MWIWVIGLGLLFTAIVWFFRARAGRASGSHRGRPVRGAAGKKSGSGSKAGGGQLNQLRGTGEYWGVRIEVPDVSRACPEVGQYLNRSLLINHAPDLPLPECSAGACACGYVGIREQRVVDRRSGEERREEIRMEKDSDRRESDRRKGPAWDSQHENF